MKIFFPSFHHSLCQPRSCLFSCFREGAAEGSSRFGILHKYLNRFWYFVMTSAAYDISALIQYWRIATPGRQYRPIAIQMDCLPFRLSSEQLLRTSANERNVKDMWMLWSCTFPERNATLKDLNNPVSVFPLTQLLIFCVNTSLRDSRFQPSTLVSMQM